MKQKLLFLTLLATALSAFSADYFVDASMPDDTGAATNWVTAKQTIQAAVDLTVNGDTVWVTNGVYDIVGTWEPLIIPADPWSTNISWVTNGTYYVPSEISVTNAITIQSVNGPDVTIIDGGGSNRCFDLHDSACVINGFAIRNGIAASGGGIYCADDTPIASNCLFFANEAIMVSGGGGGGGGGMFGGTAIQCEFNSNGAVFGAGKCWGVAEGCLFINNYGSSPHSSVGTAGAGMGGGEARNCLFIGNSNCVQAAGMGLGTAINCTFVGNCSQFGGAAVTDVAVHNCIFEGNVAEEEPSEITDSEVYHSCAAQLAFGVNGNITNEPLFVDAANGDFRLQSNSPCINWGNNLVVTNATDLDGNPRIVEGAVDMGAYEYQGIVGLADSDADGINDDWERQHGGNQKPDTTCSNGVNTILQAYIAGLDPNDPQSRFQTEVLRSPDSESVLRWNATAGRVYAVYYSTNLLSGFHPLETNIPWTAGCFTDAVHNVDGQMFYKIDVKLENASGGGDGDIPATGI
jgi:hypothetical protein